MGFLMGAYGKLMAGKLVRDLQFQLTRVTRRHAKIVKEIGDKEKYYQAQERNMKQQMQNQMMFAMKGASMAAGLPMGNMMGMGIQGANMFGYDLMNAAYTNQLNVDPQKMMMYQRAQQAIQMQFTQAQSMWQDVFEMERDADLQELKEIQSELETEKLNLESRIQIATEERDAYKKMEQADAKSFTPEFTGQG